MGLNPTLAAIKRNLPSVARDLGFAARVTSGYRSRASQTKLYNRYLAGLQPYPVAVPGTSDHEKGLALDIVSTDTRKLVDLLASVGLRWAGEVDPVHFTLIGAQIEAQPQKQRKSQLEQVFDVFYTSPIEKVFSFWEDPIGKIEDNIGLAINTVLGGLF